MNRAQYEEVRATLDEIQNELRRTDLTDAQRQEMQHHSAALSGALLSIWIPFNARSRFIMSVSFATGLYGIAANNYYILMAWLVTGACSPRLVGEIAYLLGRGGRSLKYSGNSPP